MRRALVVASLCAGGAAATACVLFDGPHDYTGTGGVPGGFGTDGGTGDAATADAREDAGDAARVPADAGPFCTVPGVLLCDPFDGPDLSVGPAAIWGKRSTIGGSLALVSTDYVSAPRALAAEVDLTTGANASLFQTLPATSRHLLLTLQVNAGASCGGALVATFGLYDSTTDGFWRMEIGLDPTRRLTFNEHRAAGALGGGGDLDGSGGGDIYTINSTTTALPGGWHPLEVELKLSAGSAALSLDGVLISAPAISPASGGSPAVSVGAPGSSGLTPPCAILIDDVRVTAADLGGFGSP